MKIKEFLKEGDLLETDLAHRNALDSLDRDLFSISQDVAQIKSYTESMNSTVVTKTLKPLYTMIEMIIKSARRKLKEIPEKT